MKRLMQQMRTIGRFVPMSAAALAAIMIWALNVGTALAIDITVGAATPSTDVVLQQLSSDDASPLDFRTTPGHRFWGQTFTAASNFTLDKVSFLIQQDDEASRLTSGMTMKVDVFGAASVSSTSGTSLFGSAQTGVTPAFTKGAQQWITFDVDNVALTLGQIYGFTIDFAFEMATPGNGHLIGNDFGVFRANGDVLADGQLFEFSGGAFNSQPGRDLTFVLQEVVPEPSTSFLGIAGLVALAGWIQRRRGHMKACVKN